MRNFGRAFERHGVRYLLISGQATVLYGASTFSEDVDLWIEPTEANWKRMLSALAECSARVHKLTPPLELRYALRGHVVHFTLPDGDAPKLRAYVDVMGVPPRVGRFRDCVGRANHFETEWGRLPVIHPRDLVALKQTQRLADYAVISALVRIVCRRIRSKQLWEWGIGHTFEAEDLISLWRRGKPEWRRAVRLQRPALRCVLENSRAVLLVERASRELALEIETARQKDREYWRPILAELRVLRRQRRLVPEGRAITQP